MITKKFQSKEEWLEGRKGKVTGSSLSDLVVYRGKEKKIGYYKIIAERIAITGEIENPMERGIRLEEEAIEMFMKKTGKNVNTDLVIWQREDNENIAISPDGFIEEKGKIKEAVEVKCLSSEKHIKAKLTGEYPDDYEEQVVQYFIVNEDLESLNFVMYDPRMPENLQLLIFVINRKDIEERIEFLHDYQKKELSEIDQIVNELTF